MKTEYDRLAISYRLAHNEMRNTDGLQPSEALDELLKYIFFKTIDEDCDDPVDQIELFASPEKRSSVTREMRLRLDRYSDQFCQSSGENLMIGSFNLSDACLINVHEVMGSHKLSSLSGDVRSAALRSFMGPDVRKGLGIFLTPDELVNEIIDALEIFPHARLADPACGSGTFLMAAADKAAKNQHVVELFGIDKNPRMLLMSRLNLSARSTSGVHLRVSDTLRPMEHSAWLPDASVDVIVTNPPFGVKINSQTREAAGFLFPHSGVTSIWKQQPSEILFVERCLQLLKPGGYLAVVLPRSVINNESTAGARQAMARQAGIHAIITLPPETFAATGTMTNTVVLVAQKYDADFTVDTVVHPLIARIDNVGYDSTGRERAGNQLPGLGEAIRHRAITDKRICVAGKMAAVDTFVDLPLLVSGRHHRQNTHFSAKLGDYVELANTGLTPPRSAYSDSGLFLVKVGNLSGSGINWLARDRNFVDLATGHKRYAKASRSLRKGDIVLTSSAHSPKYIAKKVDIITDIPDWVGGAAGLVGEVLLLRPDAAKVDPFALLAYLRLPHVMGAIQNMIRGQTAHLHPQDLLDLPIDADLLASSSIEILAGLAKEESILNERMNEIGHQQLMASNQLGEKPGSGQLLAQSMGELV